MQRVFLVLVALMLFLGASQEKGCQQKQGGPPGGTAQPGEGAPTPLEMQREVERALESLRVALEGHSLRSFVDGVDPVMFNNYADLEENLDALLRGTTELRVSFRPSNIQVRPAAKDQPARAQAQVAAEMIFTTKAKPNESQRRQAQLIMDFEYSVQGWRLTRLQPQNFFSLSAP